MATRQTSIDCYNEIKKNGLLSKRRLQTLEVLMKIAPCTASEVQNSMDYNNGGRDCMKRLSELRDRGVIYEVRNRECTVTKKNVIEWDLTDKLPGKVVNKKPTKKEKIKEVLTKVRTLGIKMEAGENKESLREIYNLINNI